MVKAALSVPSWLQDEMNSGPEHTEDELLAAIVKLRSELFNRRRWFIRLLTGLHLIGFHLIGWHHWINR